MQTITYHLPSESLPLSGNVAVYTRVGVQDVSYQLIGITQKEAFIAFAQQLGWSQEHIIVFPQDAAQHPGDDLTALSRAIEQENFQAILLFDFYQLFANADTAKINAFIRLCQEHQVLVVTLELIYNFNNPYLVKLFRFKCECASLYLGEFVNRMEIGRGIKRTR